MNLPRFSALLAAAALSFAVVWPFLLSEESAEPPFFLEVEFATDRAGFTQVYFDRGQGIIEADSVRMPVSAGTGFTTVRRPLAPGTYRQFRYDPIDRTASVRFRAMQIVDDQGRALHRFLPGDFDVQQQIQNLKIDGDVVQLSTPSGADDPILRVALREPVTLNGPSILRRALRPTALVFAALGGCLLLLAQVPARLRQQAATTVSGLYAWLALRPAGAVALTATLTVVLSSYPVVFLGKSFVSPNFSDGTHLLYAQFPTLPGYRDATTENAMGSDVGAIIWQQVPYSFIQNRALLHDGELPLWNRYNSCGTVLLGQGQSMFGDPLHLPVILANGAAWAWDLKYLAAKWLLCFGLGLAVLRCTGHLPSAAITALSSAFLGFFLFRLNHPAFFSLCYSPWILYVWLRLAEAATWRRVASGCAALVLVNAAELHSGTAKEAFMLLFGLNFAGALVVVTAARPWRERLLLLAATVWAGVLFILLTAPTWVTFLDTLKHAYTAYNAPSAFQILPTVALGFFDEIFYRPMITGGRVYNPAVNFVVLLGVLYFLAAFRHIRTPQARALAASALAAAALAFGLVPPDWIVRVPFLGNVSHVDNCFSCVLVILSVVLAGFGWQAAFARLGTAEGRGDLARVAAGFILLVWPWIALAHTVLRPTFGFNETYTFSSWGQHLNVTGFVWGSLLALTLAGAALLYALQRLRSRHHFDTTTVLLIAFSLLTLLWREGLHVRRLGPADYVFTPAARADFHAPSPALDALRADQPEPSRVVGLGNNLFPGWTAAYDLEGVAGTDGVVNPYVRDLVEALGLERIWGWRIYVTADQVAVNRPALDFLNVRHYVDLPDDQHPLSASLTPVKLADLDIYRSESAWPRAFFVGGVVSYDVPREIGARLRTPGTPPFAAIESHDLAAHPELAALPRSGGLAPGPARDYQLTTNRTAFTVDAAGPGVAVLHEAWLKGDFRAVVNGRPAEYFRVNHAFKGVFLPAAGTYRIEFAYRPRHFTRSLVLALTGLALAAASLLIACRWPALPPLSTTPPATRLKT